MPSALRSGDTETAVIEPYMIFISYLCKALSISFFGLFLEKALYKGSARNGKILTALSFVCVPLTVLAALISAGIIGYSAVFLLQTLLVVLFVVFSGAERNVRAWFVAACLLYGTTCIIEIFFPDTRLDSVGIMLMYLTVFIGYEVQLKNDMLKRELEFSEAKNALLMPGRLLTHINILKLPDYPRVLAVSDVTIIQEPNMSQRKEIIRNMAELFAEFGYEQCNIALLSLVEKPTFHMPSTVEAQTLARECASKPIGISNVVGPIAYDLIISKEAARLKNYDCPYCGEFDGVVVPNLMAGNLLIKVLEHNAGAMGGGVLAGARIPIAITSRSDLPEKAYLSLAACGAMLKDKVYDRFK